MGGFAEGVSMGVAIWVFVGEGGEAEERVPRMVEMGSAIVGYRFVSVRLESVCWKML